MFEKVKDVPLPNGTISPWPSNLAVCWLDTRNITYVAIIQANNIHVGNWDNKTESEVLWETIPTSEPTSNDRVIDVTTVGLVHPNARNFPVAVVGSARFIQVYDVRKSHPKPLFSIPLGVALLDAGNTIGKDVGPYCRGVSCNDNTILEHHSAISDISTCRYDEITVSADSQGELIIWQKPAKGVHSKIVTNQNINVVNVLRKQVIVGTLRGIIQYYSASTGDLMCEINAHMRPVNSISVAPESAYVLTSSEDGTFIVSKLHTRKPHAYQVEFRFSETKLSAPIVGAQFTNGRGSAISIASYDSSTLMMYKIVKKTAANTP